MTTVETAENIVAMLDSANCAERLGLRGLMLDTRLTAWDMFHGAAYNALVAAGYNFNELSRTARNLGPAFTLAN